MREAHTTSVPKDFRTGKRPSRLAVAATLLAIVIATSCSDDSSAPGQGPFTWIVGRVLGADFPSIQLCLFLASDGDTCLVLPGTYEERISFLGKAITVRSQKGLDVTEESDKTYLDAVVENEEDKDTAVKFVNGEGRDSVLDGFIIRNGAGEAVSGHGGGIYILAASPVIKNCIIQDNTAEDGHGGGVYCLGTGARPKFENVDFSNNTAQGILGTDGKGGGVSLLHGSVQLDNCSFSGNAASGNGSAISAEQGATVTMTNCTPLDVADLYWDGDSTISNCL